MPKNTPTPPKSTLATFHEGIQKLEDYGYTESTEIREEIRPNKQAVIKGKIVLVDGSVLHIKEYIDAKYKTTVSEPDRLQDSVI